MADKQGKQQKKKTENSHCSSTFPGVHHGTLTIATSTIHTYIYVLPDVCCRHAFPVEEQSKANPNLDFCMLQHPFADCHCSPHPNSSIHSLFLLFFHSPIAPIRLILPLSPSFVISSPCIHKQLSGRQNEREIRLWIQFRVGLDFGTEPMETNCDVFAAAQRNAKANAIMACWRSQKGNVPSSSAAVAVAPHSLVHELQKARQIGGTKNTHTTKWVFGWPAFIGIFSNWKWKKIRNNWQRPHPHPSTYAFNVGTTFERHILSINNKIGGKHDVMWTGCMRRWRNLVGCCSKVPWKERG